MSKGKWSCSFEQVMKGDAPFVCWYSGPPTEPHDRTPRIDENSMIFFLVAMPFAPSSFLLLVAMPFVPSGFLLPVATPFVPSSFLLLVAMPLVPSSFLLL